MNRRFSVERVQRASRQDGGAFEGVFITLPERQEAASLTRRSELPCPCGRTALRAYLEHRRLDAGDAGADREAPARCGSRSSRWACLTPLPFAVNHTHREPRNRRTHRRRPAGDAQRRAGGMSAPEGKVARSVA